MLRIAMAISAVALGLMALYGIDDRLQVGGSVVPHSCLITGVASLTGLCPSIGRIDG
jgi:hypothetical protein